MILILCTGQRDLCSLRCFASWYDLQRFNPSNKHLRALSESYHIEREEISRTIFTATKTNFSPGFEKFREEPERMTIVRGRASRVLSSYFTTAKFFAADILHAIFPRLQEHVQNFRPTRLRHAKRCWACRRISSA